MSSSQYDAVIVGSGPNGLAAAITLARAGLSVHVMEAKPLPGGGLRTGELTLPGFQHDICSAVHPLALASPFFQTLDPRMLGVDWIIPSASLAHPFDDGPAALVHPSVEETARELGRDQAVWKHLFGFLSPRYRDVVEDMLAPLRFPRHPLLFALYAPLLPTPATLLAKTLFREEKTRAVFAGMAGHSFMPLEKPATGAFGLLLTLLAHAVGWPIARGGSQSIATGLVRCLEAAGGSLECNREIACMDDLPPAGIVVFDTAPRTMAKIMHDHLPSAYLRRLARYRHTPGIFKVDWALNAPIPWKDPNIAKSATVHLGGTLDEISGSERDAWNGRHADKPFVLLAQPSLFDSSRAPAGRHTAWAYCHVPNGSTLDRTEAIERQIDRFAPGFRDTILARVTHDCSQMEAYNMNYVGGDINGGVQDILQAYMRPVPSLNPYRTPAKGVYICSASTPPGGGVHGMSGWHAARTILGDLGLPTNADA
jgi:phytoene dehydrogenase-like protein